MSYQSGRRPRGRLRLCTVARALASGSKVPLLSVGREEVFLRLGNESDCVVFCVCLLSSNRRESSLDPHLATRPIVQGLPIGADTPIHVLVVWF